MRKIWSEQEMDFIRSHIATMSIGDLAKFFCISYEKMNDKVHKMGLNRKKASGELWTNEEDELLKEHFVYAPQNYLLKLFSNRTWPAILQRGIRTLELNRESQDRYDVNYNYFERWNPNSAYIYGLIASDGHLFYEAGDENKNALQFEMASYDRDILEKVKYAMNYEGPVLETKRNTVKLQINNKKIIKDLIAKGIPKSNKTLSIEYPISLPFNLANHFVRGIFDGDGSVYKHGAAPRFQLLGTKKLLEKIKEVLPIDTSNYTIYDRNSSGCNVFALQIGGKKSYKIFEWMYENAEIYLDRKYVKLNQIIEEVDSIKGF